MKYFYSTALTTLLACALLMPVTSAMAQQTPSNDACPVLLQHSFLRLQDEKPQSLCQPAARRVAAAVWLTSWPCTQTTSTSRGLWWAAKAATSSGAQYRAVGSRRGLSANA